MTAVRKLAAVSPTPEQDLRRLFAEEDGIRAQLRRNLAAQREARNAYASAHGLLLRPSLEQLRKALCQ